MDRCLCKCEYCGLQWTDEEPPYWKSTPRKCGHCGEARRILVKKIPEIGLDIFGYRFSPPFPKKSDY